MINAHAFSLTVEPRPSVSFLNLSFCSAERCTVMVSYLSPTDQLTFFSSGTEYKSGRMAYLGIPYFSFISLIRSIGHFLRPVKHAEIKPCVIPVCFAHSFTLPPKGFKNFSLFIFYPEYIFMNFTDINIPQGIYKATIKYTNK